MSTYAQRLAIALLLLTAFTRASHGQIESRNPNQEAPTSRRFFYVGGKYVPDGNGDHIFADQMYVEELKPVDAGKGSNGRDRTETAPIVFIHGQAQTGTNFLNKPDGSVGWASRFLEQGHTVYIIDQTLRGRSPWAPDRGAAEPTTYSAEYIQSRFTAIQNSTVWPQARLHTQWPGPGVMGDSVFDAFYSSNVQFINNATYQQSTVQAAGAALLERIGEKVILMGHSQGGIMPILIADARPEYVKALVLLEPTGPPFQDAVFTTRPARAWGLADIPLNYSPPVTNPSIDLVQQTFPAPVANTDNSTVPCILQASSPLPRQFPNLAPLPILTVTSEASFHAPYDYCNVAFLKQAGCSKAEHFELGKMGIKGNGHMFFMERNSDEIQGVVKGWIDGL